MSDAEFDPYYLWLGIPPAEQPPNHYRLLGVVMFESNRTVIEMAADRQMSFLRQYGTGAQSEASQKLLNEVSQALIDLLNPAKKAAYDERLKQQIDQEIAAGKSAVPVAIETPAAAPPVLGIDFDEAATSAPSAVPPTAAVGNRARTAIGKTPSFAILIATVGVVSIAFGAGLGSLLTGKTEESFGQGTVVVQSDAAGAALHIDGQDVELSKAASPLTLDEGRHTAELRKNGSVLAASSFWIVAGNDTTLKLNAPQAPPVRTKTPAMTKGPSSATETPIASKPSTPPETKPTPTEVAKVDPAATTPSASATPLKEIPPKEPPEPTSPTKPEPVTVAETPKPKPSGSPADDVTLREIRRITISDGNIDGLALSSDGGIVAAQIFNPRAQSGAVRVWSTSTGKEERHSLPTGTVNPHVRFSADGTRCFYINTGRNQPTALSSFLLRTGKSINVVTLGGANSQRPSRVTSYAISSDDSIALFALSPQFNDQTNPIAATAVYDLKKKREIKFAIEQADAISAVALSADGTLAAAAFRAHRNSRRTLQDNIRIWDVKSRDVLYSEKFDQPTAPCHGLHFTTDGAHLVVAGPDSGNFSVIDISAKAKISSQSFNDWRGSAAGLAFIPATAFAIAPSRTDSDAPGIRLIDYRGGRSFGTVTGEDVKGDELAVSDDGSTVASGGRFSPLILWRVERR